MSGRRFTGVIFDLDGTLADTLADIGGALNAVLTSHGFPVHPLPAYRAMVGEGVEELISRALPAEAQGARDEVLAGYRASNAAHLVDHSAPYPGICDLLDALTSRGVAMGVLSNKGDDATQALMRSLFSRWHFAAIAGARPEVPRKPDPQAAIALAASLQVAPADCAFVGDTWVDIATARAAGMGAVGVAWGFRSEAELRAAGAEVVLHTPLELLDLVLTE